MLQELVYCGTVIQLLRFVLYTIDWGENNDFLVSDLALKKTQLNLDISNSDKLFPG
jgi:hypothetical protein